jgi:hypothetical protein
MNVQEEVQLAIDMNIESALEFVLLAKLNYNGPDDGYWGYFNNKRVWLSRVSSGKLCDFNVSYDNRKILDENKFLIKEIWDVRVNKPYPKKYFTDIMAQTNYELKINAERIERLMGLFNRSTGHNRSFVQDMLTESYEYETKLMKRKSFVQNGDTKKSLVLSDYKNHSLIDVISNYGLELIRAGSNRFKMCCPFHKEKTPSFFVAVDKNRFNCFGCGEYGDTLDFIKKYEQISVIDAAKKLTNTNT